MSGPGVKAPVPAGALPPVPLKDQLRAVGRELGMRRATYPGWIERGKMKPAQADAEIAAMGAAYGTLKTVEEAVALLKEMSTSGNELTPTGWDAWCARAAAVLAKFEPPPAPPVA